MLTADFTAQNATERHHQREIQLQQHSQHAALRAMQAQSAEAQSMHLKELSSLQHAQEMMSATVESMAKA